LQVVQELREQQAINQIVVFQLDNEYYGADIAVVREVVPLQRVTYVPRTPDYVLGVINLRGRVIPVIDLRRRLGLPMRAATKATRIAIGEVDGDQVGMVVDSVEEVARVPAEAVEPPSSLLSQIDREHVLGVAKLKDRLITLLDLRRILVREERRTPVAQYTGRDSHRWALVLTSPQRTAVSFSTRRRSCSRPWRPVSSAWRARRRIRTRRSSRTSSGRRTR